MRDGWFAPMKHGAGTSPAGWQGWAVLAGFVLCLAGGGWGVFTLGARAGVPGEWLLVAYLGFGAVAAAVLLLIVRRKTLRLEARADAGN